MHLHLYMSIRTVPPSLLPPASMLLVIAYQINTMVRLSSITPSFHLPSAPALPSPLLCPLIPHRPLHPSPLPLPPSMSQTPLPYPPPTSHTLPYPPFVFLRFPPVVSHSTPFLSRRTPYGHTILFSSKSGRARLLGLEIDTPVANAVIQTLMKVKGAGATAEQKASVQVLLDSIKASKVWPRFMEVMEKNKVRRVLRYRYR